MGSPIVAFRPHSPGDRAFILATWLRALRHGNPQLALGSSDAFFAKYHALAEGILNNPKSEVWVASTITDGAADPDHIAGYAVVTGATLHFVYVKPDWRKNGIARSLVPLGITSVSCLTKAGFSILKKHPNVSYNPLT